MSEEMGVEAGIGEGEGATFAAVIGEVVDGDAI